jgi:hypothetical protein
LREPIYKLLSNKNTQSQEKYRNKYDLNVGEIPKAISDLSETEIKVISILLPHVSVVYTKWGRFKKFKGHVLNFI